MRFRVTVGREIRAADALPEPLGRAIARRLDGDRRVRIPLDLRGHTPFEVAVWTKALEIPRGEVRPYGWIAAEIGKPKAVRAVGTALAHNPVPLVVPCHRVVRSDGLIGQYSMGGPDAKRRILAAEGLDTRWLEAEAAAGHRFTGSDTTHIVCHTTCRDARRVTDRHRVTFASLRAAEARRLPAVQALPAGVAGWSRVRAPTGPTRSPPPGNYASIRTLDHPTMPSSAKKPGPSALALWAQSRHRLRHLGLDVLRHRDRHRDDPAVHDGRDPVRDRGR